MVPQATPDTLKTVEISRTRPFSEMTHVHDRVYVSGPMTGYPGFNTLAFQEAAAALEELGYVAVDPSKHVLKGADWTDYIRIDVVELLTCKAVCVLPGWQESKGATLEVHIAQSLGMNVHPLEVWKNIGIRQVAPLDPFLNQ